MTSPILIGNNGPEIASTDYWTTEHALAGLCYLSGNAGALRLLVPKAAEGMLAEMRTGVSVTVKKSIPESDRCVDVVFEDGTDSPFALTLDRKLLDRSLTLGKRVPFTVWTEQGKELSLFASINTN